MSEVSVLVAEPMSSGDAVDEQLVRQLADRARAEGLRLTGEGGLLQRLTKVVMESALDGEMDDHLGYRRHDPAGRDGGNSRNGKRAKTLLTEAGPVDIEVPRDRDASFEPRIVAKRQRRLNGLDDLVISLSAKGLTHGEICAQLKGAEGPELIRAVQAVAAGDAVYGAAVARRIVAFYSGTQQRYAAQAFPSLTPREREVLDLLGTDARNHEIARRLRLSEKTVRNHISALLLKLEVPDRTTAAARAREAGLGQTR